MGRLLLSGSLSVALSAGLLCWSPVVVAQSGPVCRQGCPCGNACIDCSDTCRIGTGTARDGDGFQGYTPQQLATAAVIIVALIAAVVAAPIVVGILTTAPPEDPMAPRAPHKGKEPCRTDEQCPPGFSCVDHLPENGVGLCAPAQSREPDEPERKGSDDWFGQTQRAVSAATATR